MFFLEMLFLNTISFNIYDKNTSLEPFNWMVLSYWEDGITLVWSGKNLVDDHRYSARHIGGNKLYVNQM